MVKCNDVTILCNIAVKEYCRVGLWHKRKDMAIHCTTKEKYWRVRQWHKCNDVTFLCNNAVKEYCRVWQWHKCMHVNDINTHAWLPSPEIPRVWTTAAKIKSHMFNSWAVWKCAVPGFALLGSNIRHNCLHILNIAKFKIHRQDATTYFHGNSTTSIF